MTDRKNSNLIAFDSLKQLRLKKDQENQYKIELQTMQKFEVLRDLLMYDERIKKNPDDMQSAIRAQLIMETLEARAELKELRDLASEYRKKIATKIYQSIQNLQ